MFAYSQESNQIVFVTRLEDWSAFCIVNWWKIPLRETGIFWFVCQKSWEAVREKKVAY